MLSCVYCKSSTTGICFSLKNLHVYFIVQKVFLCVFLYLYKVPLHICKYGSQKRVSFPQSWSYNYFGDMNYGSLYCKTNAFNIWAIFLARALFLKIILSSVWEI